MTSNHQDPSHQQNNVQHNHCHCCGPTEFEFPEELMTPELQKMKDKLGEEAFLEMMEKMVGL